MSQTNMKFIGVSTSSSSIMKIFPAWNKILGINASISGIDIPLNANPDSYISAINQMVNDSECRGALVTTHKLSLYQHAKSLFQEFDDFADTCGEVSCVKIKNGKVSGFAKDPISAGLAIKDFLPNDFFDSQNEVLLIGDGGAAIAIAWYLSSLPRPPAKIHVLGKDPSRLNNLFKVISKRLPQIEVSISKPEIIKTIAQSGKALLIINATGMGKDLPGSPWPNELLFPKNSYLWELNYRGSLEFYHQGKSQEQSQQLTVVDGWNYFIYGWTLVISEVFDLKIDSKILTELKTQALINR